MCEQGSNKLMEKLRESYIEVNSVSTKISIIGKEVGQSFEDSEDLVVIVPGNPGINSFYDEFAGRIHEKLNCSVWCVGHAGHNYQRNELRSLPKFNEHKDLYGLRGQVEHKVDFFDKYLPKNARVHLIGHSVGSYIVLEMLNHPTIQKQVDKSYLLFPAIEYMAKTSNGRFLVNFVKYIVWLLVFLTGIFAVLPGIIQAALLRIYMIIADVPKYHCDNITQLLRPVVLKRVFFLAYEEMDQILQRNDDVIRSNFKKIKFLYGKTDGWSMKYYEKVKNDHPDTDVEVTSINHSFVLKDSLAVGDIVSDWIKSRI